MTSKNIEARGGLTHRDALLDSIFVGRTHPLRQACAGWLAASRSFAGFCEENQPKIRKKARSMAETGADLHMELETAFLLLRERAFTLEYEPGQRQAGRSPDFAVWFTTSLRFMAEVTRLQAASPSETAKLHDRVADALCDKLGQLQPGCANVVFIGVDAAALQGLDVAAVAKTLQHRAENNNESVIGRHGFKDRADFFAHFRRLSAIILRCAPALPGVACAYYENPLAKFPLPARVKTALLRANTLPLQQGSP